MRMSSIVPSCSDPASRTVGIFCSSAHAAKGAEIAETKLPKLDSGDLGDDWKDWIVAHALLSEAKALIEGPSAPVAAPSVPK